MMRMFHVLVHATILSVSLCGLVRAGDAMVDTTLGKMRIELHVLPAEPFFTKSQVDSGKVTQGMLIMGGAAPVAPDAESHPNRHLVVHVFDTKTSKAVVDATVKMSFQPLDDKGLRSGSPVDVPVVVMQAIGKGDQSTHYGNNVALPDGPLAISLIVNGKKVKFKLNRVFEQGTSPEKMYMH
jgi:hypothetical protein